MAKMLKIKWESNLPKECIPNGSGKKFSNFIFSKNYFLLYFYFIFNLFLKDF